METTLVQLPKTYKMDPVSQDQQHSPEHAGGTCDPYTFLFFNLIRIQVSVKMFLVEKNLLGGKMESFYRGWLGFAHPVRWHSANLWEGQSAPDCKTGR